MASKGVQCPLMFAAGFEGGAADVARRDIGTRRRALSVLRTAGIATVVQVFRDVADWITAIEVRVSSTSRPGALLHTRWEPSGVRALLTQRELLPALRTARWIGVHEGFFTRDELAKATDARTLAR
ncbi:hypothetical protein ACPZ19_38525 [Amycolatopsis lurida]